MAETLKWEEAPESSPSNRMFRFRNLGEIEETLSILKTGNGVSGDGEVRIIYGGSEVSDVDALEKLIADDNLSVIAGIRGIVESVRKSPPLNIDGEGIGEGSLHSPDYPVM